jgi:hypothetical protein
MVGRSTAHLQTQAELLCFLDDAVVGWNAHLTPPIGGDKRSERRLGGSGATVEQAKFIAA